MTETAKDRARLPDALRAVYAPVCDDLDRVEQILREELSSEQPFVDRLAKHCFRLGGKRLRPALVLLSARACGRLVREHLVLAAAMEMIHTATLIHDDVLDEAMLRRHLDTVNARWDNEASILLGDYLFARSVCLINSLDDLFASRAVSEAAQAMCEGELRQVAGRGNYELPEEEYFGIIAGKTATLTACCCRLGAHYAGAEAERCEALARFGHYLGIAFQIADDLLDMLGEEATVGKSLGTDLLKQKSTLPLIRLLSQASRKDREEILAVLKRSDNHRRDALRPWFERSDAVPYARQKALWYAQQAGAELAVLPVGDARDGLQSLAEFVVRRKQ